MRIEKFEDIIAWQKAQDLSTAIYSVFRNVKDFSFRDQIQRASVSVMNNIAEGFERKGNKEFARFLHISKGSCGEVRSMLHLAFKLGYVSDVQFKKLYNDSEEISRMLAGFIKSL